MFKKTLSLAAGLALMSGSLLAADSYAFDNNHCEVGFSVVHWSVSKVHGTFDQFTGDLNYDAAAPEKSSVNVSIVTDSVNTRQGMRDKHLKSPDFFDAAKYPAITFKSTSVAVEKDGKTLDITGDLSIRDVTKSVVLKTSLMGPMTDGQGKTRLGFEASTSINRKDFGVAWNKANSTGTLMVSEQVDITINGEAVKK